MSTVTNLTHPLFERFGKDLATVLANPPVYKYWPIKEAGEAGLVLVRFRDGAPALLDGTFKGPKVGKVLLWALPLCAGRIMVETFPHRPPRGASSPIRSTAGRSWRSWIGPFRIFQARRMPG